MKYELFCRSKKIFYVFTLFSLNICKYLSTCVSKKQAKRLKSCKRTDRQTDEQAFAIVEWLLRLKKYIYSF